MNPSLGRVATTFATCGKRRPIPALQLGAGRCAVTTVILPGAGSAPFEAAAVDFGAGSRRNVDPGFSLASLLGFAGAGMRGGLTVVLSGGGDTVAFFSRKLRGGSRPSARGKRRRKNRGEGGSGKRDRFAVELHDLLRWLYCSSSHVQCGPPKMSRGLICTQIAKVPVDRPPRRSSASSGHGLVSRSAFCSSQCQ